jgi:hypothetical protein
VAGVRIGKGAEKQLASLINRLEKFDKENSKLLKKDIKSAANRVVGAARGYHRGNVLRNWGTWIDAGTQPKSTAGRNLGYKNSYKLKTMRYRQSGVTTSFGYDAVAGQPGTGVFQFAGSKGTGPRTMTGGMALFRQQIVGKFGPVPKGRGKPMPRVLASAYYQVMPDVTKEIEQAIDRAMRKVGN